jgi:hypothetical protein
MSTATLKNTHCNIGENLLQQREKAIATSQALLMQHSEKTPVATKSTVTSRGNCCNNEKNYCNISRTTAIFPFLKKTEKRLLQQPRKSTIATFHIICCNVEKESLQQR